MKGSPGSGSEWGSGFLLKNIGDRFREAFFNILDSSKAAIEAAECKLLGDLIPAEDLAGCVVNEQDVRVDPDLA